MELLITLLIVVLLGGAALVGWRYGLVVVGVSLLALLFGIALASLTYRGFGDVLAEGLGVEVSLARVNAYLVILVVGQFIALFFGAWLIRRLPRELIASRFNHAGGVIVGVAQMAIILGVFLGLVVNSPISPELKRTLSASPLAVGLADIGEGLQGAARFVPGAEVTDTLNLLTVDPQSDRMVQLGFTVTNGTVDVSAEQRVFDLLNAERTQRGLPALTVNAEAQQVARAHSRDMFVRGYFSHRNLDGQTPFDRMRAGGVEFGTAGENLALAPTAELVNQGLMNSPGHRANILSTGYKRVGIGVIDGGRRGLMVTQNFTD